MDKHKLTPENRSAFSLRIAYERTQKEIAAVVGLKDGAQISLFEKGHRPLSYEYLEEIAASLKVPPEGVEALLFAHRLLWGLRPAEEAGEGEPEASPLDPTAEEHWQMWRTAIAGAWSVAETLYAEFDKADVELAQGWKLWQEGDPSEPEILAEWRLHELEASLRREQRLFQEALACVARAFDLCGGRPEAAGHILLVKEQVCYTMGDISGSLAALEEAAPFIEAEGDSFQLFFLRFKTAKHLCALGRYAEAARLLPVIREMAIEQGMELNLIRVAWSPG